MKSSIFWDITPCGPLKVNLRFGGTPPPSSGYNKPSKIPVRKQLSSLDPEDGGDIFLRNVG
jgi:hypothetical protein